MSLSRIDENLKILSVDAKDIRWPTSLGGHGSDAMVNIWNSFLKFCHFESTIIIIDYITNQF